MRLSYIAWFLTFLEISQDGRMFAQELGRTIVDLVSMQCDAIDARARAILADAEAIERSAN
jgi:hypothetical protein